MIDEKNCQPKPDVRVGQNANTPHPRFWSSATALLLGLAFAKVLLHCLTNGNYGYFRDELYYIACSDHLAWGYVDHPPLSLLVLKVTRLLFGDSIFAIRLPVVLAGAACVVMTGLLAREMGGGWFAQLVAALAYAVNAVSMAMGTFFSMNAFDHLFWIACAWLAIRIVRTENPKLWLAFGAVAGIAMLNKISIGFFGFGIVVGLLLTSQRRQFLSPWIWAGGAIAFVIFLPHILWQFANDFPTLEFISEGRQHKIAHVSPLRYLLDQVIDTNPHTVPVWLIGLACLLFARSARPYRFLGFAYLAILTLFIVQKAKAYYLAPAYPMLYAMGAVAIERFIQWPGSDRPRRALLRSLLRAGIVAFLLLGGVLVAPMAVPILPPETCLRYQEMLGFEPPREEVGHTAALPQHFADRLGWENMVAEVAAVYRSLSPEERARCVIFADNYGQAGAVDFFGPKYGLPKAICAHNNYWLWGYRDATGEIVIWLGRGTENSEEVFEHVERAATVVSPHAQETNVPILICRGLKRPVKEVWPELKGFI